VEERDETTVDEDLRDDTGLRVNIEQPKNECGERLRAHRK
jgi:hypothetical protein